MFQLKTNRLLLRDFREEDLVAYQNVGGHPQALKYYEQDVEAWKVHAADLVERFIRSSHELPRLNYTLAIIVEASLVGAVSVRTESSEHQQGSIGCGLAYEHWSKGYALEAMQAAIGLGFERVDLHRIYAETISENTAAITLAQRAGMRVEGGFKESKYFKGRWWGTTILSIIRSEWHPDHT